MKLSLSLAVHVKAKARRLKRRKSSKKDGWSRPELASRQRRRRCTRVDLNTIFCIFAKIVILERDGSDIVYNATVSMISIATAHCPSQL